MPAFNFRNKDYDVDSDGFLIDFDQWDENFAVGMAPQVQINRGLKQAHWDVINFIHDAYAKVGKCPNVYQTCRINRLNLKEFKSLFPTGYLRGACRLAGVSYREGYCERSWSDDVPDQEPAIPHEKTYLVNVRGFLVDPSDWDEQYAICKAFEMKMPEKLTRRHWQIIYFMRDYFRRENVVPSVYQTCEANFIELQELERLFPDGYHRGAVKLAGLRVR